MAQAFSSLTSFLVIVIPGRYLELGEHGHLVFGVALCQIVLSLVRASCGETLLVLATRGSAATRDHDLATGAAVLASAVGAVGCVVIATVWAEYRLALLATALVCIPVCVLDALRYRAIAIKRSGLLLAADASVCVLVTIAFMAVGRLGATPVAFLITWGVCCALACLVLGWRLKVRAQPAAHCLRWLRRHHARSSAFVAEAAVGAVSNLALLTVMALVTSSVQVAVYRTALTILGVTSLINNFLRSTVLRELNPQLLADPRRLAAVFSAMLGVVTAIIVVFGLSVYLAPATVTSALFGANFAAVMPALIPAIVHRVCTSAATVPTVFLRAQGVAWEATRVRIAIVSIGVLAGSLGAGLAGARGAFIADASVQLVLCIALTWLMTRAVRSEPQ